MTEQTAEDLLREAMGHGQLAEALLRKAWETIEDKDVEYTIDDVAYAMRKVNIQIVDLVDTLS